MAVVMMIYTERDTSLLYEVQLFNEFVLVRPASPGFGDVVERLGHDEFMDRFEEFWGDPSALLSATDVDNLLQSSPPTS